MIEVLTAWLDGQFVEPDQATLGVFDHAITVGDGLFEATKIVDGVPIALTRHLDRLERSAARARLTVPIARAELDDACRVVAARTPGRAKLRLTVTAGVAALSSARGDHTGSVLIAAASMDPPPAAAAVTVVEWPRNERGALAGVKSTSYLENVVALTLAQEMGSDEAIFANTVGNLCEGTGSNVFVVVGGRLITPPLPSGPLAGVTRALVLQLTDAVEEDLPIEAFSEAEEAFLTSCTRDVQPIGRINGRALHGVPGPTTEAAAAAYLDLITSTPDP